MRARRRVATTLAALSLVFVAVSCDGDDDNASPAATTSPGSAAAATTSPATTGATATTAASEPTTGGPAAPETASPTQCDPASIATAIGDGDPPALYRAGIVLVKGGRTDGKDVEPPAGLRPLDAAALADFVGFGQGDNEVSADVATASFTTLLEQETLTPYAFDVTRDPLDVAAEFEKTNEGVQVSPVLLTVIAGHWTFAPGTAPDDHQADPGIVDWKQAAAPDVPVGVVDTGYTESSTDWLAARVDPLNDAIDAERGLPDPIHGHGMFVGSLIAQQAPQAKVLESRLTNLTARCGPNYFGTVPDAIEKGFASDELQLYVAIDRLVTTKQPFKALNLSLGSYGSADDPERSGFAILGAVNLWNSYYKEAPILAAAGNHEVGEDPSKQPFLPAAYGQKHNVVAIASVDRAGMPSKFSNPAATTALGEDVLGIRDDAVAWTSWGGTSFATAVATAATVNNKPIGDPPANIGTAP